MSPRQFERSVGPPIRPIVSAPGSSRCELLVQEAQLYPAFLAKTVASHLFPMYTRVPRDEEMSMHLPTRCFLEA